MDDREGNASLLVVPERLLSDLVAPARFEMKLAAPFIQKSLSENTKAAYRRVIKEFFAFAGERHPSLISHTDVIAFRDCLLRSKQKAATIAFKLSVVRSFFEYLKA